MPRADHRETPMMSRKKRWLLVLGILLVLVLVDQATKRMAIETLKGQPRIDYLGGTFSLVYAENTGAFLSLGSKLSPAARFWTLTAFNGLILALVFLFLVFKKLLNTPVVIALALIFAGGIGNLIDRVFRDGRVVDFMNMGINVGPYPVRTGIFNVADVAIMVGLFFLVTLEFLAEKEPDATPIDGEENTPDAEN
jgi:signal peptidase II